MTRARGLRRTASSACAAPVTSDPQGRVEIPKTVGRARPNRDVLEERRHSPFQVLDASAIEGIRGLVGESSSIYSCIQIYKALTPPAPPPPQRIVARQKDYWKRGGGGVWPDPPSSYGPPRVPAEGGPKIFKLKSSGRRSKIWLKHWKGRRGSRGGWGAPPMVVSRSNTSLRPDPRTRKRRRFCTAPPATHPVPGPPTAARGHASIHQLTAASKTADG